MGLFRSNNKQRYGREQEAVQVRPGSSAASFNNANRNHDGEHPASGRVNGPRVTAYHANVSATPSAYQHRSNDTPLASAYNTQGPYRNGTVASDADFRNGIETHGSDSLDEHNIFGSALWNWIPHVVQSADDASVVDRVKDLFVFAEQFVNNFYADQAYEHEISDRTLERVSCSSVYSTAQLRKYLSKADCHTSLIKHTLVSLLLDLISFDSASSKGSLLPKEFQNYNIIAKARTTSTAAGNTILDLQSALSSYRVLSAYIRSDIQDDSNFLQERQPVVEGVVRTFESAFRFWTVESRTQEDRQAALRQLLYKTGELGIFLFSQPSVFVFNWDMTIQDQSDHLVPVWPRLLKVYDEEAQPREIADHLIPMRYGVVFRKVSNQQKLAQANDEVARGPTQSVHSIGNNGRPVVDRANPVVVSQSQGHERGSTENTHRSHADPHRESISPLNSDDEGSNKSWMSHNGLNIPQQISSNTRLHQETATNRTTPQPQPDITAPVAIYPPALIPGIRGTPESFRTNGTEHELHIPQHVTHSSQSLPQPSRVLNQSTRAHTEDYSGNINTRTRNERPSYARNFSNETWQTSESQQRRRPSNQHSHSTSNAILDGERPPPYSSPNLNQQPDRTRQFNRRNASPPHPRSSGRTAETASSHAMRSSQSSLTQTTTNTSQFSRTGQDQMYFPPPPGTQKPRRDSFSNGISKFLHRRPSTSGEKQTSNSNQTQHQPQRRERDRDRDRDRDRNYPPNAWSGRPMGTGVETAGDQNSIGYSMIEREGRPTERGSERRAAGGKSRSRQRSSSLASSVRSFLMGDR